MIKKIGIVLLSVFFLYAGGSAFAVTPDEIREAMDDRGYTAEIDGNIVYVMSEHAPIAIAVNGSDGDVSYLTYLRDVTSDTLGYEFLNTFNNEVQIRPGLYRQ